MTSHVINLTRLGEFSIITYSKVNLSFIIYHLTYLIELIFTTNFFNQLKLN